MSPASPPPAPFARPQRVEPAPENRGSMLRASILESAMELGVGTNRTVANWMFNTVDEVEEEEEIDDIVSPSLTYASTATSEESNLSAGLAQYTQPGAGILINGKDTYLDGSSHYFPRSGPSPTPDPMQQRTLQFDLRATPEPRPISPAPSPQPPQKNKLRKLKPDGYDSDGGYISENGKAKKEKEKKEKKSKKSMGKEGDGDGAATDYDSDGGHLSESSGKKKSKKKAKSKSKNTDSPTSEYETDKDRGFTSPFSRSRSRKQSVTSPHSGGEESDGGYLSESSKKKRFFRLNSKSRKKQDSFDSSQDLPPPVPALPTLPPPIYEKFSRSGTPLVPESRNVTPVPTVSLRPSVDTLTSLETTTSIESSGTTDTWSTTVESEEKRESFASTDGLTRAFQDAESVRSPSVDFLSTFRRPTPGSPLSPSRFSSFADISEGSTSAKSPVPALSTSKPPRPRPLISAPNTIALATKHTPLPLTLTPPTPTSSQPFLNGRIPPSPDPEYVLVTPNPSTSAGTSESSQSSPGAGSRGSTGSSNGSSSPVVPRPHVLAYYDLPPPSPPPRGPLPDVPSDISRSTSPSWSVMLESSPSSRFSRSAPTDRNDPHGAAALRATPSPIDRSNTSAPHPLSREISRDVPTIAQPVPPAQRGRVSPFPTAPVLPREQTTTLMRQTSKLTQEAVTRALKNGSAPASATPYTSTHGRWPSHERIGVASGPASAQPYPAHDWPTRTQPTPSRLPPRASPALDARQAHGPRDEDEDDERSWLVYDDDDGQGDVSDQSLSVPTTRPASAEPPEPSPDVNAILAGFRAQRDAQIVPRRAERASARDTLAGIVAGYERETVYLDVDEDGGDRSSVWSDASRYSFLDTEKSATIRAKFVKRVEAMYGKEIVPPVPRLNQGLSS